MSFFTPDRPKNEGIRRASAADDAAASPSVGIASSAPTASGSQHRVASANGHRSYAGLRRSHLVLAYQTKLKGVYKGKPASQPPRTRPDPENDDRCTPKFLRAPLVCFRKLCAKSTFQSHQAIVVW